MHKNLLLSMTGFSIVSIGTLLAGPVQAASVYPTSPQIIPTPGLSCTVKAGKPHYSTYWAGKDENYIDTHTYVTCNETAQSLQPVAYLYVLGVFGTYTYWEQMPAGSKYFSNVSQATSPQSKGACTYGTYWWYGSSGFAYINGGGPQNAANSYSNVYVPCFRQTV